MRSRADRCRRRRDARPAWSRGRVRARRARVPVASVRSGGRRDRAAPASGASASSARSCLLAAARSTATKRSGSRKFGIVHTGPVNPSAAEFMLHLGGERDRGVECAGTRCATSGRAGPASCRPRSRGCAARPRGRAVTRAGAARSPVPPNRRARARRRGCSRATTAPQLPRRRHERDRIHRDAAHERGERRIGPAVERGRAREHDVRVAQRRSSAGARSNATSSAPRRWLRPTRCRMRIGCIVPDGAAASSSGTRTRRGKHPPRDATREGAVFVLPTSTSRTARAPSRRG